MESETHFDSVQTNFDVLLTVHLSIILVINQLNAQLISIISINFYYFH